MGSGFPRDKRGTRLRGKIDRTQSTNLSAMAMQLDPSRFEGAVESRAPYPHPASQFSLRLGIGASNGAISAVFGALPLKVSTLPSEDIATVSPSFTSPERIISASGSCR